MMDMLVQKTMERIREIAGGEAITGDEETGEDTEKPISETESPEVVEEKVEEASPDDVVLDQIDETGLQDTNVEENS